jgi:hypothetical protein
VERAPRGYLLGIRPVPFDFPPLSKDAQLIPSLVDRPPRSPIPARPQMGMGVARNRSSRAWRRSARERLAILLLRLPCLWTRVGPQKWIGRRRRSWRGWGAWLALECKQTQMWTTGTATMAGGLGRAMVVGLGFM